MADHPIEPGIYDMPEQQYFDYPAFSNSDLKLIARSPGHYWAAKRDPKREPETTTPVKIMGKALHCAILEPDAFPSRYLVAPADAPKRPTKPQINAKNPTEQAMTRMEFWTEFDARADGREIFTSEEYASCMEISLLIRCHPELMVLLKDGLAEKSVFAVDPETGLLVKCRTDFYANIGKLHIITDLKSTEDARPFQFQRSAYQYGYFQQAALYSDIWKWSGVVPQIDTWIIAAFEKVRPYGVKLYEIAGENIEFGRKQYRYALNIAAECQATDSWPSYDTDITPLNIPAYASVG